MMCGVGSRDRIVDAARSEFLAGGIAPTRMDTIASRVGIARPNVYRYFRTKQDLVKEVILREIRAVNTRRRDTISLDGSTGDIMLESLVAGAGLIGETEFLAFALANDREQVTRFLSSNDESLFETQLQYWEPILAQGRKRGDINPALDDHRIITWFMNNNFSLVTLRAMYPGDPADWFADFVIPPALHPARRAHREGTNG